MAITNFDTPTSFVQMGQPLMFVAYSDNTAQTNFQYVFEVEDASSTSLGKMYIPANTAGRGMMNLAPIIRGLLLADAEDFNNNALIHDMPNAANEWASQSTTGCQKFTVKVGEVYGAPLTEYLNLDSQEVYVLSGYRTPDMGYNTSMADYYTTGTAQAVWLTDAEDNSLTVRDNQKGAISFINDTTSLSSGSAENVVYSIYDNTGTLIVAQTVNMSLTYGFPTSSGTDADEKLVYLAVYPANLDDTNSPILSTHRPSNNPDWKYYTIHLEDALNARVSDYLTFNRQLDAPCKHEPTTIGWQNSLGGWDYIYCVGRLRRSATANRVDSTAPINNLNGATYTYNSWTRQTSTQMLQSDTIFSVDTGKLQKSDGALIRSLFRSKQVMANIGGQWYPIQLETKNVAYNTELISRALSVTLQFKIAQIELFT